MPDILRSCQAKSHAEDRYELCGIACNVQRNGQMLLSMPTIRNPDLWRRAW